MKKTKYSFLFVLSIFLLTSCGETANTNAEQEPATEKVEEVVAVEKPLKRIAENVNVDKFEDMIGHGNGLLLDVRTQEEFEEGHIEGATLINFFDPDFADQIEKLDKSQAVYIYCKSGGRSGRAMGMMKDAGFTEVYNLIGGYSAWADK